MKKKTKKSNPFNILPRLCPEAHFVLEQHSRGGWFQDFFTTEKDALAYADYTWHLLTAYEKKNTVEFYVASIEISGDEDDMEYEVIDIIKEYC